MQRLAGKESEEREAGVERKSKRSHVFRFSQRLTRRDKVARL